MTKASSDKSPGPSPPTGCPKADSVAGTDAGGSQEAETFRSQPCPICQKMSVRTYRPFCSRRCADVDLARWLGGRYAIPAGPAGSEDDS